MIPSLDLLYQSESDDTTNMINFMIILKSIVIGFFTGFVMAIPIGPSGIESVRQTLSKGFKAGFKVSLGAVAADVTYFLLISEGLANLLTAHKSTEGIFWIIAGLILCFIGYYSNRKRTSTCHYNAESSKRRSAPFLMGFIITFTNPLSLSFWLTLSGTVLSAWRSFSSFIYYCFVLSLFMGMITWFFALNLMAYKGVKLLNTDKSSKTSKMMNILIFIIGLGFVIFGFVKLFI